MSTRIRELTPITLLDVRHSGESSTTIQSASAYQLIPSDNAPKPKPRRSARLARLRTAFHEWLRLGARPESLNCGVVLKKDVEYSRTIGVVERVLRSQPDVQFRSSRVEILGPDIKSGLSARGWVIAHPSDSAKATASSRS